MISNVNPIELRDRVVDDQNPAAIENAIRDLITRGWPTHAICAELPTIGEGEVRRLRANIDASAA